MRTCNFHITGVIHRKSLKYGISTSFENFIYTRGKILEFFSYNRGFPIRQAVLWVKFSLFFQFMEDWRLKLLETYVLLYCYYFHSTADIQNLRNFEWQQMRWIDIQSDYLDNGQKITGTSVRRKSRKRGRKVFEKFYHH